jgi:superfamily II DNA or RNA helicase
MDRALLTGWFYVPLSYLGAGGSALIKRRLTHLSPFAEPGTEPLRLYDESREGFLGVPREFGLETFKNLPYDDQTVLGAKIEGVTRLPDPRHPRVRDPEQQARFMEDMLVALRQHKSMTAMAATGSGKTVVGLRTAAVLGRRTLILVHLERLMHQWVDEIREKLGVADDRIGIVQQNRCEWEGKDFAVGLLHSVCRRDYGQDFRNAFGFVIYDEVHKVGSQFFAPAVHQFPSRYRLGLSATMERSDGGDKVYFYHLGPIRVQSGAAALPMDVHAIPYAAKKPPFGRTRGSLVKAMTMDDDRNAMLVKHIVHMYRSGRQGLVVSDGVAHLQVLMEMCARAGVPPQAMGQYTGERHLVREDPKQPGRGRLTKIKLTKDQLDAVKANAQIIFATYGMMTEGIDIPRLDAGIDATPRGKATQIVGRIRRPMPGKKKPIWVTIRDVRCPRALGWYVSRCKDYRATGAEVIEHGTKKSGTDAGTDRGAQEALLGSRAERPTARALQGRSGIPGGRDPTGPRELPATAGRTGPIRPQRRLP